MTLMTRLKNAQTAIGFLVVLLLLRQFAKRADASASASVAGWPVLLLLLPPVASHHLTAPAFKP